MTETAAGSRTDARDIWVLRVLGIDIAQRHASGRAPADPAGRLAAARASWDAAIEQVDEQISALQSILRKSGDEDLKAIAEFGLSGVTGNHRVKVMASLHELRTGPISPTAAARAAAQITAFRTHLATDARVAACDENPFGINMAIRATLDRPLAALAEALRTPASSAAAR